MRCTALAEELTGRGWHCRFVVRPGTVATMHGLLGNTFEWIETERADDPGKFRELIPKDCNVLVVDSYRLGFDFERSVAGAAQRLLVIDDMPRRKHHADILLDPTLGRKPEAYSNLIPAKALQLMGPSYALLRRAFATTRRRALSRV